MKALNIQLYISNRPQNKESGFGLEFDLVLWKGLKMINSNSALIKIKLRQDLPKLVL